ncbi:protein sneaky isoform X2 [Ischnura elegans]|uniref:protein sneaky isoform X2 n=1 Tax=Ischnura elegans TaxID=197161 RepID=UPI001ED882F8|nr:protein sneaky isoform X2 [Ischnura elegans]
MMAQSKIKNILNGASTKNIFKTFAIKEIFSKYWPKKKSKHHSQDKPIKKKWKNRWKRNCGELFQCCLRFRLLKYFAGFKFGVLLGVGIHELVFANLDFSDNLSAWTGMILCLILGIGNAFSAQTDTSELKNTMKSMKKVVLPLASEIEDEREVKEEEEKNDYIDSLQGNSKRSEEIEQKFKIKENDTEGKKYEKEYMKKLETRCAEVISHGTGRCHQIFMKAYDRCYDKVSFMAAWLLCWPMQLTFVCNVVDSIGGSASVCDPNKEVEPGFGDSFAALKESEDLFEGKKGGLGDVKIKYEAIEFRAPINIADAKEAALSLQQDFKEKKASFDVVSRTTRILLSFVFIKVLLKSQEYHDKYLQDFNHDNYWITPYFRRIDARRHAQNKLTLLPLKKGEKTELCSFIALLPRPDERKAVFLNFLKILLEAITATVFILFDRLLSEILSIIRMHARIDFNQTGKHELIMKVKGTGMMAHLVRSILGGFNIKQQVQNQRSNYECLPNPTMLHKSFIVRIYGLYFAIWVLVALEAYTQRFRRLICSVYYRKVEKRRILFLYNETLRKRAHYYKRMAAQVRERFKEAKRSENTNLFKRLRFRYPKHFGWLYRLTDAAQLRCLVCRLPEGKMGLNFVREKAIMDSQALLINQNEDDNKKQRWHICQNSDCQALYCKECWKDIKEVCYVCTSKDKYFTQNDPENEVFDS